MSEPAKLVRAFMTALCLTGQPAALAAADVPPIRILCEDARLAAMCDELALALSEAQAAHPVEVTAAGHQAEAAHLTLRFETARFTESVVAGHLSWRDAAGRSGTGTEIDLTVMDATINDDLLRDYARQLLSFTDLPL